MNPITALPLSVEPHPADTDERELAARVARGQLGTESAEAQRKAMLRRAPNVSLVLPR